VNEDPRIGAPQKSGTNWKLWMLGIAALLLAIVVVQNSQEVPVDFLFVETTMPLIFGLLAAGALGFVIGWLVPIVRRGRRED
jgi:uncharacterized integral membrane protein